MQIELITKLPIFLFKLFFIILKLIHRICIPLKKIHKTSKNIGKPSAITEEFNLPRVFHPLFFYMKRRVLCLVFTHTNQTRVALARFSHTYAAITNSRPMQYLHRLTFTCTAFLRVFSLFASPFAASSRRYMRSNVSFMTVPLPHTDTAILSNVLRKQQATKKQQQQLCSAVLFIAFLSAVII